MENFTIFSNWLNQVLEKNIPTGIKAFNFNLYEGTEDTYDIELIGSDEFDEEDPDWACTDFFTTGENLCFIKRTSEIQDWEEGQNYITLLIKRYLEEGVYKHILKSVDAIGIGFVDGDIEIIYQVN